MSLIFIVVCIGLFLRYKRITHDQSNRNGNNYNLGVSMANVKQGNKTSAPQWWKHLRDWKRVFWKSERMAQKKAIKNEQD